jgi:hypothetical protein
MRAGIARIASSGFAILICVLSSAAYSAAGQEIAPEIDASSISTGLGLLTAGVLMLRARRSK